MKQGTVGAVKVHVTPPFCSLVSRDEPRLLYCTRPGSARGMAERASSAYFRRAGLHWMMLITMSMGLFTWTVFWPKQVPFQNLGPIGSFVRYLVEFHYQWLYYGYWVAWAIHLAESLYCVKLCRLKGINDDWTRFLWALQTFLFGAASLSLLTAYKPGHPKKRR